MPTVYPAVPAFSCPVVRTLEFETRIFTGVNGTEQRIQIHAGRESWTLPYPRLTLAQRNILIAAFEAAQGAKDQALDFVFLGTTYSGCFVDWDKFSMVESTPLQVSASVTVRQVVRAPDSGAPPADFPTLTSGAKMQLPYTYGRTFDTVAVRTEGGRYVFANRAASLQSWSVGGSVISDAEAAAIWDAFRKCNGRYRTIGFTDPDSATHVSNCRFGSDILEWRYMGPGQNSITATIQQVP